MAGSGERLPCYGSWLCSRYVAPKPVIEQTKAKEIGTFIDLQESEDDMIAVPDEVVPIEDSSASVDSAIIADETVPVAPMTFTWALHEPDTHKVRRERGSRRTR